MKTKAFLCIALLCLSNIFCKEPADTPPSSETHLSVVLYGSEVYDEADDTDLEFKRLFEKMVKTPPIPRTMDHNYIPKEDIYCGNFFIYIKDNNGNILEKYSTGSPVYIYDSQKGVCLDYNFHKDFYNYLGRLYLKDSKLNAAYIYLYSSLTLEDFYTCYGYATLAQRFEGQASVNIADIASEYSEKAASPKDLYNRIGRAFFEDSRFLLDLARFMGRRANIEDFYTCYGYVKFLEYSNAQ